MDILEELKIETHNCTVPGWATRAAQEIERLRGGEVVGYAMVRNGKVCGLESTVEQTKTWNEANAVPVVMVMPNAELSGPRPLAAEGSRSNDGLERTAETKKGE